MRITLIILIVFFIMIALTILFTEHRADRS